MEKSLDSYEVIYAELEAIIESLQSGDLNLDEAVANYERSTELIHKLEKHLKEAQNKITKIKTNLK
jgi:exodeoxyribonuclease VII small subunit